MRILVVSSSLAALSRSERLALIFAAQLTKRNVEVQYVSLKDKPLPKFSGHPAIESATYKFLHQSVTTADGLILASPLYNWTFCAELKNFVEHIGSTDDSVTGALFDKVVTFVTAAGLPHSYVGGMNLASSLMLDFKCVINPYQLYVDDRQWDKGEENDEVLAAAALRRLEKTVDVMIDLTKLLIGRSYTSRWDV